MWSQSFGPPSFKIAAGIPSGPVFEVPDGIVDLGYSGGFAHVFSDGTLWDEADGI